MLGHHDDPQREALIGTRDKRSYEDAFNRSQSSEIHLYIPHQRICGVRFSILLHRILARIRIIENLYCPIRMVYSTCYSLPL